MGPLSLIRRYGVNPYDLPQDEDEAPPPPAPQDQGAPQLVAAANAPVVSAWGAASIPASAAMMESPPAPPPETLPGGGGPGGPSVLPSGLVNRTGQTIGNVPSSPAPKPQPQSSRIASVGNPPTPPKENFFQTLARMLLTPKLGADQANAMVHPKWTAQEQQYETDLKNAVQQDTADALVAQRQANAAVKNAQAERQGQIHDERVATNTETARQNFVKSLGPNAVPLNPGEVPPAGWSTWTDPTNPMMHYARPGGFIPLPAGMEQWFPGKKAGDIISNDQYNRALQGVQETLVAQAKLPQNPKLTPDQRLAAQAKGLDPNHPENWTPEQANSIFRMIKPPPSPPSGQLTPEAIAGLGEFFGKTGQLPSLGFGKDAAAMRAQILNNYFKGNPDADPAAAGAIFRSDRGALAALQKNREAVITFENTAARNLDIFLSKAQNVVDSGSPWVNQPLRSVNRAGLGSADQSAFDAARRVALNEIAKVVTNPNLTGQLSDSARHEVESLSPENSTLAQVVAVANVLKQDMANRHIEYDRTLAEIKGRLYGTPGTPQGAGTPQYKVGDTVMYQGAPHMITAINNGKLVLAP